MSRSLASFEASFEYDGNATCAADGMCQEKCPVKINTGDLIKHIRSQVRGGRWEGLIVDFGCCL